MKTATLSVFSISKYIIYLQLMLQVHAWAVPYLEIFGNYVKNKMDQEMEMELATKKDLKDQFCATVYSEKSCHNI